MNSGRVIPHSVGGKSARVLAAILLIILALTTADPGSAKIAIIQNKLSGAMQDSGSASHINYSPDGLMAVFIADRETDQKFELYSASVLGGAPVKLNGPLVYGGIVEDALISPDSQRVVYLADQELNDQFELYSVALTGGTAIKLNQTLTYPLLDVGAFEISSNSLYVVYTI